MVRLFILIFATISCALCQNLPALQWAQQPDGSAVSGLVNVGSDSQGNIYLAGTTFSPALPVKAAIQNTLASAGLDRIDGPGSAYTRIGTSLVISALAANPKNPNVFYAVSSGSGFKSVDGGNSWTAMSIPAQSLMQFVVDPVNDQNVYTASYATGILKSTDSGATWNVIDNGLPTFPVSAGLFDFDDAIVGIDPNTSAIFVEYGNSSIARSTDGGASWQPISVSGLNVYFETPHSGVLYVTGGPNGAFKSTDDGQTFQPVSIPVTAIFADPAQAGRLLGNGAGGVFESDDDGTSWTLRLPLTNIVAADWANGFLYGYLSTSIPGLGATIQPGVVQISRDLKTVTPVGPPTLSALGLVVANGHIYVPINGGDNIFVTKLDPNGNVIYSTYFGGTGNDQARAMAVDAAGNVYVTGGTSSMDFPTTKGSYAPSFPTVNDGFLVGANGLPIPPTSFLFKLNPDGSLGYSTYFPVGYNNIAAIAVDGSGSAYLTGLTQGGVPVTPGAYQSTCACAHGPTGSELFATDAFLTKFDPTGATLVYSTYLGVGNAAGTALAVGSDASAYIAASFPGSGTPNATTVYRINPTGSALLKTATPNITIVAMAFGPDGNLYLAGAPITNSFQPSPGVFQTTGPAPALPFQSSSSAAIEKMDAQLQNILAATYFGGPYGPQINAMAIDAAGNVDIGGTTLPHGLPTRTPLFPAFGVYDGFLSQLSGDLSTLKFSTYLGDQSGFQVFGVAAEPTGNVVIGGLTYQNSPSLWVNSISVTAPPTLRIDAIDNAASMLDGPLAAGETIVVKGAGFASDAQLTMDGQAIPTLSVSPTEISAVVPSGLTATAVFLQVQSGGAISNAVPFPVASTAPGIFSVNGSGTGQGYILNQDGTLNSPSNPAHPGDPITILATGVGPVSFTAGYAVTANPVNVFISGTYCDGVAAVMGNVAGFPGSVYQITVLVPTTNATSPNPQGLILQVGGQSSQNGLAISIAQ